MTDTPVNNTQPQPATDAAPDPRNPSPEALEAIHKAQTDTLGAALNAIIGPTQEAGGGGPHVMMQLEVVVANIVAAYVPPPHYETVLNTLHNNTLNRLTQHLLSQVPAQGSA